MQNPRFVGLAKYPVKFSIWNSTLCWWRVKILVISKFRIPTYIRQRWHAATFISAQTQFPERQLASIRGEKMSALPSAAHSNSELLLLKGKKKMLSKLQVFFFRSSQLKIFVETCFSNLLYSHSWTFLWCLRLEENHFLSSYNLLHSYNLVLQKVRIKQFQMSFEKENYLLLSNESSRANERQ